MHDHSSHKLLAKIALTVSPFAQLPTSITLPYDYTSLPASLPPPSSNLIVSSSGLSSATPDSLITTCNSLVQHLSAESSSARKKVDEWVKGIEERELSEKRKIAPGYLDTGVMLLEPTKMRGKVEGVGNVEEKRGQGGNKGGEELDRAFGGLGL